MKSELDNSNCFMTIVDLGHSRNPACMNDMKVVDLLEAVVPTKFELSFEDTSEITFEVVEPEPPTNAPEATDKNANSWEEHQEKVYNTTTSPEYDKWIEDIMGEKGNTMRKYDNLVCNVCKVIGGIKCPCPLHETVHGHGLVHFEHNNEEMDNPPKWLCVGCFRDHYNAREKEDK